MFVQHTHYHKHAHHHEHIYQIFHCLLAAIALYIEPALSTHIVLINEHVFVFLQHKYRFVYDKEINIVFF